MDNYICKIADREELIKRWEYLLDIHPGSSKWLSFRKEALNHLDEESTISHIGILDGQIICEATAYIQESAFKGDINEPSGLLSDSMAYLAAFRTNKEFEGRGYFGRLYRFMENDLLSRGYNELSVGVEPEEIRNNEIYRHLGFVDFIKQVTETEVSDEDPSLQEECTIYFYRKKI